MYQGKVSASNTDTVANYTGATENTVTDRLHKHRDSFRYEFKNNFSALSKHVWETRNYKVYQLDTFEIYSCLSWIALQRALTDHIDATYA